MILLVLILIPLVAFKARAQEVHYDITVGMMGNTTMHDGNTFPIWGFREGGGMMSPYWVPGPTIRAKEGEQVFLHFWNTSMLPHTIHPHGVDASQANDGVPQTSFELQPMGTYDYEFTAPHPGTYAYHCHVHTVQHLQMGMYGTIVIDPADGSPAVWQGGPTYDLERIWVTGEYDSYWHTNGGDPGSGFPYHDYNPDYFIVNGQSGTDIAQNSNSAVAMDVNQSLLVRVNNMGFLAHRLHFSGLSTTVVSSDGRPLPVQTHVSEFTVYPGERYDFIVEPDSSANYTVVIEYLSVYDESVQGTASIPVVVTGVLTIGDDETLPETYSLSQNYPNPFNPATTIRYGLPKTTTVVLKIYNALGQEVRTLINRTETAGYKSVIWDGRNNLGQPVASGMYVYRLQTPEFIGEKKLMLVR